MPTKMIVEHFRVGVRMAGKAVVNNLAKLFVCEYRSKSAVKDLASWFCESPAYRNITPHFQVFALKRSVICLAC